MNRLGKIKSKREKYWGIAQMGRHMFYLLWTVIPSICNGSFFSIYFEIELEKEIDTYDKALHCGYKSNYVFFIHLLTVFYSRRRR